MNKMKDMIGIIEFIKEIEGLKSVERTAWSKSGRRESTAEHSWRLAVLAIVVQEYFKDVDINKVIQMSLIHDLGELYEGDISAILQPDVNMKLEIEEKAMNKALATLPVNIKEKVYGLWGEYNKCETKEARLVKALDKLETIIQHNQGKNPPEFNYEFNLSYGKEYFEGDELLKYMRDIIDKDTRENIDVLKVSKE